MTRRHVTVALALAAMVLHAPAAPAADPPSGRLEATAAPDCVQIPPDRVPPVPADTSTTLRVSVRVIVDRPDLAEAKRIMGVAVADYARIGIALRVRYDAVRAPASFAAGQQPILDWMKKRYGGKRPRGADVVYFPTRQWYGGFADCIGGVRWADRAFAFGSVDYKWEGVLAAPTVDEGHIAAHEIGHLLGGHHHYSNCAEAHPSAAQRGDVGTCTVMTPSAYTITGTFSTVEAAYLRAYAAAYAKG